MDRTQQQQPVQMEMSYQQPPPGYPTDNPPAGAKGLPQTKARGEKGFIEGCLAALCCCWICETCCI